VSQLPRIPDIPVAGFWVAAAIFGAGAVICGTLFRPGPLRASASAAAESAGAAGPQASREPAMHV
jgi:hypothetical protein